MNDKLIVLFRAYDIAVLSLRYVGVNAPVTVDQVKAIGKLYAERLGPCIVRGQLIPFLGLMVSFKSLHGLKRNPKWAKHYAEIDKIPELMDAARSCGMKCIIHYNTVNPDLCKELEALENRWNRIPDGWQLNIVWPEPRELEKYLATSSHATTQFIIQVGSKAFERVRDDTHLMTRLLTDYNGLASYFLFDLSGGIGKLLDVKVTAPILEAMQNRVGPCIAVAGGLGPETVKLIGPLVEDFPNLSWDAQGQLRDENDELDLEKIDGYLQASQEAINLIGY